VIGRCATSPDRASKHCP